MFVQRINRLLNEIERDRERKNSLNLEIKTGDEN